MDENAPTPPTDSPSTPPPVTPPPPLPPPPVIVAPRPGPPRRGGRGWMVAALILLVLLIVSGFFNLGHIARLFLSGKGPRAHSVGPRLEEVVTEDNDASDKIAVVDVEGIITSHVAEKGGYSMV